MRLAQPGRKATGLDALVLATVGAVTPSAHACECVAAGAAAASGTARSAVRAGLIAAWALALLLAAPPIARAATDTERVERVLAQTPLIDGHNDLPWEIRARFGGDLAKIELAASPAALPAPPDGVPLMTDIPRLRAGRVGAQFWSVWIPAATRGPEAVQMTLEQIDLVKALCARYPADLAMAYTAADIVRVHKAHRIGALIGVEGGHQINNSLAVLRAYYEGGARYMTLTHSSNTDWADSATDTPAHHGLTPFGREVVREMNRLGMLVDLAHVSADTMRAALTVTEAPVIFSHSSARALVDHPRDVPDDVLQLVALGRRGWGDAELAKVAGANLLRVLRQAEGVSARLRTARPPSLATLAALDGTPALPAAAPGVR